jgi:thiamine kinase-like enzyme
VQRYLLVLAFAAMSEDPRLAPALAKVWPGRATAVIPIEAGITNRNYRVDVDDEETFVLRLAGTDTELLGIDRAAEVEAGRVAAEAGVGPEVFAFEPDLGCIVTRFVGGSAIHEDELGIEAVMRSVVASIRAIHESRLIGATFPVFRIVERYRDIAAARGVRVPDDYEAAHAVVGRIEEAFSAAPAPLTTCHNDLLNANFLLEGEHTWIVDYEYAGMGDPFFDLGNLSINNGLDDGAQALLLRTYFGEVRDVHRARLALMRIVSDLREAMWGVVQQAISTLDFDYVDYATRHFRRLLASADDPRVDGWLEAAREPLPATT